MRENELEELDAENLDTIIKDLKAQTADLKASVNIFEKENTDLRNIIKHQEIGKCVLCHFICDGNSALYAHLIEMHQMNENFESRSCEESNNDIEDSIIDQSDFILDHSNSVMYHCDKCDFEYEEEDAVKSHKELYHENNCAICGENFDEEEGLKSHKKLVHSFKCDHCDFESTSQKGLMIHKGVKHKVEPGQNIEKICVESIPRKNKLLHFVFAAT